MASESQTLVIVDDQPDAQEVFLTAAAELGVSTRTYDNGKDFCSELKTAVPDAVILDITMPGMDGIEVVRWMVDNGITNVPLGLVSGKSKIYMDTTARLATVAGIQYVQSLRKSATYSETRDFIRSLLDQTQQH